MSRERTKMFGCRIVGAMLVGLLPVLISAWPARAGDVYLPGQTIADNLYFEPIEGLTTARHLAPRQTAIPVGTQLYLFLEAPMDAQVTLTGAIVIGRNPAGVSAVCPLNQVGPLTIRGVAQMPDGTTKTSTCKLDVVAIPISEIAVSAVTPSVAPLDLDDSATNEATMALFFGESIAALRPVAAWASESESGDGAPRRRPGQAGAALYRTSIDRTIRMVAEVNYPDFKPLMEWRINGAPFAMGQETERAFYHTGMHSVEVGPPANSAQLRFDTYSVSIVSHSAGGGFLAGNESVTFEAVTNPPGYENRIEWLSSTKYGTAAPVHGTGPSFTVQFDDTIGHDEQTEELSAWLGVRADNAVVGDDPTIIPPGIDCFVTPCGSTFFEFCLNPLPADFFGPGSDPFDGTVSFGNPPGSSTEDTRMERFDAVLLAQSLPSSDTTAIELVFLSLANCQPLVVTFGGQNPEDWDATVVLSQTPVPPGEMTITKEHTNGGVFCGSFNVQARFVFNRSDGGAGPLVFDTGDEGLPADRLFMGPSASWVHDLSFTLANVVCAPATNFAPGISEDPVTGNQCCRRICHPGGTASHCNIVGYDCSACEPGACCLGDGTCTVVEANAGTGQSPIDVCEDDPGGNPSGLGGTYMGDGTDCRDDDRDGLADVFESADCGCAPSEACHTGTDPCTADTDGDGLLDGLEVLFLGSDPCTAPSGANDQCKYTVSGMANQNGCTDCSILNNDVLCGDECAMDSDCAATFTFEVPCTVGECTGTATFDGCTACP